MKVLIGTNNKAKVKKYGTILDELKIEYCTPNDLNLNIDIEETGNSPEENSRIKALAYYNKVNMPVIVDDSCLYIEGLAPEDQPGVFTRRYKGRKLSDEEWIKTFSKILEGIGGQGEGAFVISISIVDSKGQIHTNTVRHERHFVSKPCSARNEGYPANSLIYDRNTGKYLAEVYEGSNIYKGNSFEKDYEFIKLVLKGNK